MMCFTVSSQDSSPSSTKEAMTVAVKALVMEPIWKSVEGVIGSLPPFSFTPKPCIRTVESP